MRLRRCGSGGLGAVAPRLAARDSGLIAGCKAPARRARVRARAAEGASARIRPVI